MQQGLELVYLKDFEQVLRETSFLFSVGASEQVSGILKGVFGDNKIVEYASAFFSGAISSAVGHPTDAVLSRWQAGLKER